MKRATIIRWTGRGNLASLADSVARVLGAHAVRGGVSRLGNSIVVRGPEPLSVAAHLQYHPGISWIAAGFVSESPGELVRAGGSLAKLYLRPKDGFSVEAEATGSVLASDVGGAMTSKILGSVHGARVSESPKIRFRVAADGPKGAVGVEVRAGAGGAPMGAESAHCLVSGGIHSSVTAWMAVLAGFRVSLVHAKSSDESLLAVARLYSELSYRADPRGLKLEVLEGESVPGAIAGYVARSGVEVLGGFHSSGGPLPEVLKGRVSSPLYLLPEERFRSEFASLAIKAFDAKTKWGHEGSSVSKSKRFVGGPAGISAILDGLR